MFKYGDRVYNLTNPKLNGIVTSVASDGPFLYVRWFDYSHNIFTNSVMAEFSTIAKYPESNDILKEML